ncbi:phage tail family protein [Cytobacillus oceanisediminis]|uniref:Siphovirus-type tail component RIFT-related domain-containing protein n=1 Tax=Cytobacillus oceanisediminis TaxID=665099 RepID=A0ABX3CJE3_9BACI|nr:phage tail family protein [Cytobacillus oceanisediminis]OHX39235.1 hypothetical protein BBV17_03850 [Cytobacillus oceanisediminis]
MSKHDYLTFQDSIDVLLEKLDGTTYNLKDSGIGVADFVVSSPHYSTNYEETDGRQGMEDTGTTIGSRQIKLDLYFVSLSMDDYSLKRDEIFRLFNSLEPFYISESRSPKKRWKVKVEGAFSPEQKGIFGFFDLLLVSACPYALSKGSTLNPGWGFQVSTHDNVHYTHTTSVFSIWNDGDVAVDPREHYLKIVFRGASESLTIRNLTTEEEWIYNGNSFAGDIIELNGIRSLKNGSSIFGQTNKKLITLSPGMNEFEITGAVDPFEISFDFNFLYL